jgi:hypothetical protein
MCKDSKKWFKQLFSTFYCDARVHVTSCLQMYVHTYTYLHTYVVCYVIMSKSNWPCAYNLTKKVVQSLLIFFLTNLEIRLFAFCQSIICEKVCIQQNFCPISISKVPSGMKFETEILHIPKRIHYIDPQLSSDSFHQT